MRRFVIGDIHGCGKALRTLIETIDPDTEDEIVFMGDYIDRGPDSRDVVQQVLDLRERCQVVALRGNHEIMLLGVAGEEELGRSPVLNRPGIEKMCIRGN